VGAGFYFSKGLADRRKRGRIGGDKPKGKEKRGKSGVAQIRGKGNVFQLDRVIKKITKNYETRKGMEVNPLRGGAFKVTRGGGGFCGEGGIRRSFLY